MLGIIGLLVLVFPYADYYRRDTTAGFTLQTPVELFATKGDYDSFPMIVNTVEHVSRHGHTDGQQALGSALFWFPRSVWPTKPLDTGILVTQMRGSNFTNVSAPLWAEAFIDGGWILLACTFVALGWFMRRASTRGLSDLLTHEVGAISTAVLSFYMLIILRGSLLQAMCVFTAIITCLWFVRQRAPT